MVLMFASSKYDPRKMWDIIKEESEKGIGLQVVALDNKVKALLFTKKRQSKISKNIGSTG